MLVLVLAGCGRISFDGATDAAAQPLEITKLTLHDPSGALLLDVTNGGIYDITPCAVGERQMLPMHTKQMRTAADQPDGPVSSSPVQYK